MNAEIPTVIALIYVFVLAVFVGFEVISKVPVVLHTPLMSGTNAIHGIVMLGGVLVLAKSDHPVLVVLGYKAEEVKKVIGERAEIVISERYEATNSLYSLGLAREMILRHHPDHLAALANHDLGVKGKPA